MKILGIKAREILDSRRKPTVEVAVKQRSDVQPGEVNVRVDSADVDRAAPGDAAAWTGRAVRVSRDLRAAAGAAAADYECRRPAQRRRGASAEKCPSAHSFARQPLPVVKLCHRSAPSQGASFAHARTTVFLFSGT